MSKTSDVTRIMSEVLNRYRNSIPRKAFIRAMERVIEEVFTPSDIALNNPAPGLQIIKRPDITAGELADLLHGSCPPYCGENSTVHCDVVTCRNCWLSWLVTGNAPEAKDSETQSKEGLR